MWFILADSDCMEKIIHLLDVLFAAGWLMNLKMALTEHSDVTDPVCEFLRGANAHIQQRANICCLPDCECLCKSVTTTADVHGWGAQRHMRTGILTSGKNVRVPCLPFSDVGRIHGRIKKKYGLLIPEKCATLFLSIHQFRDSDDSCGTFLFKWSTKRLNAARLLWECFCFHSSITHLILWSGA